jgi:hypothetical protein
MNWPAQGAAAFCIGLGWFAVVLFLATALTRWEKKYLPKDQDDH